MRGRITDNLEAAMKVVTVEEMRRIEAASDAAGHSYAAMMERAGQSVARAITLRRKIQEQRILVLVGPGNNGGDGLVAARYLAEVGAQVACYLLKPRDPAADQNYRLIQDQGLDIALATRDERRGRLRQMACAADVIVDALLGTGARLPLQGSLAEILALVKEIAKARRQIAHSPLTALDTIPRAVKGTQHGPYLVAVDGPTGLDYDSGTLDDAAIPADLTITFAYPKVGHFLFPGAGKLGELVVADIGTDPALADDVPLETATPELVRSWLPPRPRDAHKGTFGKALIVAGSVNYTGAAYLAGAGATRAGAGLVTLAVPSVIHSPVAARLAEATYLLLPHELGAIASGATRILDEHMASYDALLLGPGLGQEQATLAFVEALLDNQEKRRYAGSEGSGRKTGTLSLPSLVIDADGLNLLATLRDWPRRLPPDSILTPHPGEMARLAGCSIGDVQAERLAIARSKAKTWGQIVVLKGAHTVAAAPDGRVIVEPFANPGLATAGTGDVLAGTIVALLAQGVGAFEAAAAGAYLHGLAGELAREENGTAGMVAGDVLARLPHAWQCVTNA
jgi:NAD(P)H-hydrate epimerase